MNIKLRPELKDLPSRMVDLPIDDRGYPVPWFVAWVDGKPEFRAMDPRKFISALKEMRCWVCGQRLGVNVAFVAGPMCGINRTSSEPPSHKDCAIWSACNCPFLTRPHARRREDEQMNNEKLVAESAGMAIPRNPGVAMVWITERYEVHNDGTGKPLIEMGEPNLVLWFAEGRSATRVEVEHSVETGMQFLLDAIEQELATRHFSSERDRDSARDEQLMEVQKRRTWLESRYPVKLKSDTTANVDSKSDTNPIQIQKDSL